MALEASDINYSCYEHMFNIYCLLIKHLNKCKIYTLDTVTKAANSSSDISGVIGYSNI